MELKKDTVKYILREKPGLVCSAPGCNSLTNKRIEHHILIPALMPGDTHRASPLLIS